MRLLFLDLHNNNFLVNTFSQIKAGIKIKTFKHGFLLDYFIKQGIEVCDLVTGTDFEKEKELAEYVFGENKIEPGSIRFLSRFDAVDERDVCIVYFHNFHEFTFARKLECKKVLMGNHFVRIKSGQFFDLFEEGYNAFVNETDVSDNPFVKEYFNTKDVKLVICPYIYTDRFVCRVPFHDRKKKMLAIGTLSTVGDDETYSAYREFYGTHWVQPFGAVLLKSKWRNKYWMDSNVSYIYQGYFKSNIKDPKFIKYLKTLYNNSHVRQSKYTKFDMVSKFNEYRMFVRPEELAGIPSVNVIEGMACGCLYFGSNNKMYSPLGLKEGEHYVGYDGSLQDLKRRYKEVKDDEELSTRIAKQGMEFVRESFNSNRVAAEFLSTLEQISRE